MYNSTHITHCYSCRLFEVYKVVNICWDHRLRHTTPVVSSRTGKSPRLCQNWVFERMMIAQKTIDELNEELR